MDIKLLYKDFIKHVHDMDDKAIKISIQKAIENSKDASLYDNVEEEDD